MRADVDRILAEKGLKGIFYYSDSSKNANMYYLSGFWAPDPFIFFKKVDEDPILVVNQMELDRARQESRVKDVRPYEDYDFRRIVRSVPEAKEGIMKFVVSVAKKEFSTKTAVCVSPDFPVMLGDYLRKDGLNIRPTFDVVEKARETKEPEEVKTMKTVQEAVEEATLRVIEFIADADIGQDGNLYYRKDGRKQLLTVGRLRPIFDHAFADRGCVAEDEMIIACGSNASMGHYTGKPGDIVKAHEPVVLDVFPKSVKARYFSDMTRTVVKGRASKEIRRMFETVLQAKNSAMDAMRAGVLGKDMQLLCFDLFEKAGYETIRGGKQTTKGYTHGLGHGVGLEIHEGPGMGELSTHPLCEHNIITVEPGLYDPRIGGVRIEDIVEVTSEGCRNLTEMEICLEI